MAVQQLTRNNIQAIFRYMPCQPYNWSSRVSVIGESPRQVTALDVPEGWVEAQLRRLIYPFTTANAASGARELDVIDRGQFQLVKAEDLRASRFPNTFLCRTCQLFRSANASDDVVRCPGTDHGAMEQFSWVEAHECGHLKEITAPSCPARCRAPMHLMNTRDLAISRWYWQCGRCHARSDRPIVAGCSTCRTGRPQAMRIPQSSAYYPQQLTVINPPTRNSYSDLAHEHAHAAAVAQSLGVLPRGAEGLRLAAGSSAAGNAIQQVHEMAATLGWTDDNQLYRQALADAEAKTGAGPAWVDEVKELGLDAEHIAALGDECRQRWLAGDAAPLTVEDLLTTAAGSELEPQYHEYGHLFADYGLKDVVLLRELPIAYIVAGFTRISGKAVSTTRRGTQTTPQFRFFPTSGRDNKFPMYGVRTETEGLMFQLDQLKVVDWLVASGVVPDPGVQTAEDAQRWLFKVTEPVGDIFNAPRNQVSRAVLGLTHSIAHRAMKSLATRCGLNVDSLAEYLFPLNCSFLIYANTRSEFTLGGLEHVFRYDLADALRELDAETRCVFDPPCRHSFGGACAACLHLSEIACARFNTVLDRNMLFGSVPDIDPGPPGAAPPSAPNRGGGLWRAYWAR